MFLRMVYDDKLAQAAYLIGCQKTGEAIVIDPERDVDRYIDLAAKEGLRLVAAAETHIHADFLSGCRELAERSATVYLSDEGGPDWRYQWLDKKSGGGGYSHRLLNDGDVFAIGNIELEALHTPGHTPEHISFLITDKGGGATEPMGIATGDFVFVGDLGRPDLLETAAGKAGAKDPAARQLHTSLGRFSALPDYLQVWPAHGAGSACGKALGAVPQTTVGYERRFNPAIAAGSSEEKFVSYILAGQPEPPVYFARMKRLNRDGPPVLGSLPRPARLSTDDLAKLDTRKTALVDTRPWKEFSAGHIPGSLFHPVNGSFTTDVGSMVREDEPIVLIIEERRVDEAVRDLVRIGLDRVVGWIGPSALKELGAGRLVAMPEVSVTEAAAAGNGAVYLDVRRASEFSEGHAPGALNIAHTRLAAHLDEVPKGRRIFVGCRSGGRSARACAYLQRNGYDVANVAGGFLAWEEERCPVEH